MSKMDFSLVWLRMVQFLNMVSDFPGFLDSKVVSCCVWLNDVLTSEAQNMVVGLGTELHSFLIA